jgi:hypothetical protein
MKSALPIAAALALLVAGAAQAQTTTTPPGNTTPSPTAPSSGSPNNGAASDGAANKSDSTAPAAVSTADNPRTTAAPVAGANSYTEGQARARMEEKGFGNVTDLKKDDKGVWRGTATKDGKSATVALDYQGNVVSN